MKSQASILIIDDDPDVLTAARLLLKRQVGTVATESDPAQLPACLSQRDWDLVLLDMNFAPGAHNGSEGLHWLEKILSLAPRTQVILMTAYGAVDTAVKAMKQGACDFILKPWQNERLLTTIDNALRLQASTREVRFLRSRQQELQPSPGPASLLGESSAIRALRQVIERVAPTDASVLIQGENGSGKDVAARLIHQQSARADEVFVSVDLGAVTESLFDSELFGHRKGAFTGAHDDRIGRFQAASGGTLFLDEIGNLPLHLQARLLTVLEQRQVIPVGSNSPMPIDVRLICATNRPLRAMVERGEFRQDLYYRLNTLEIELPPLRERPGDIRLLLEHFLQQLSHKHHLPCPQINPAAWLPLREYDWPGNVRELSHAAERALIMAKGHMLQADDLLPDQRARRRTRYNDLAPPPMDEVNTSAKPTLSEVEKQTIAHALRQSSGNVSHAARALGITRASLYRRMEKHGL